MVLIRYSQGVGMGVVAEWRGMAMAWYWFAAGTILRRRSIVIVFLRYWYGVGMLWCLDGSGVGVKLAWRRKGNAVTVCSWHGIGMGAASLLYWHGIDVIWLWRRYGVGMVLAWYKYRYRHDFS